MKYVSTGASVEKIFLPFNSHTPSSFGTSEVSGCPPVRGDPIIGSAAKLLMRDPRCTTSEKTFFLNSFGQLLLYVSVPVVTKCIPIPNAVEPSPFASANCANTMSVNVCPPPPSSVGIAADVYPVFSSIT